MGLKGKSMVDHVNKEPSSGSTNDELTAATTSYQPQPSKEEYNWEAEQKSNIEHYVQVQADLLALKKEVEEFFESTEKAEGPKKNVGPLEIPPEPTTIDLQLKMKRLGLGLEFLDQIGLVEEDIGLTSPVVLLDYPSPPHRYMSLHLSEEEIRKCREKCQSFSKEKKLIVVMQRKARAIMSIVSPFPLLMLNEVLRWSLSFMSEMS